MSHVYNHALERALPGKHIQAVVLKIFSNVGLLTPAVIAGSFTTLALLEHGTETGLPYARTKVVQHLPDTWMAGAAYWPFVSFALFRVVPVGYRAPWGSIAAAMWNTYLSHQAYKPTSLPPAHSALHGMALTKLRIDGLTDHQKDNLILLSPMVSQ
jgi:hypothetical protein